MSQYAQCDQCKSTDQPDESGVAPNALREALDSQVSERDMYAALAEAARVGGWLFIHHHDSQHSAAGFPDIIALRGGELLALECKTARGQLSQPQRSWLAAWSELIEAHGLGRFCEVRVVRPCDMPEALARLVRRPGSAVVRVL